MDSNLTEGQCRQRGLLAAMDREWAQVVAGGAGRRAWRRWAPGLAAGGVDAAGLDDLVAILRHPGDHTRSDIVARVLLGAAQAGDELAARTIQQGLVPFTGRLARLYARNREVLLADAQAEVVAVVQLRIMRTRVAGRDRLLVGYLQLTVRRHLAGRTASRRALVPCRHVTVGTDHVEAVDAGYRRGVVLGAGAGRSTAEHVATIVTGGVRTGALSVDDATLLLLAAAGNSAAAIARRLQRDPSVITRRLQRATVAAARVAA